MAVFIIIQPFVQQNEKSIEKLESCSYFENRLIDHDFSRRIKNDRN